MFKQIAKVPLVRTLLTIDLFSRQSGIPILQFHRVSPLIRDIDVHSVYPEEFRSHMTLIKRAGYRVLSLKEISDQLKAGRLEDRVVGLTFDDGHKDNIRYAYPILKQLGMRATIFVLSGYVGRTGWLDRFGELRDAQSPQSQWWELLDWSDLENMSDAFDIGVHGHTHRPISDLAEVELEMELVTSREIISNRLGKTPSFYCYPYGKMTSKAVDALSKAGYDGACGTVKGLNTLEDNLFMLKRNEVGRGLSRSEFELLLTSQIQTFHRISKFVNGM